MKITNVPPKMEAIVTLIGILELEDLHFAELQNYTASVFRSLFAIFTNKNISLFSHYMILPVNICCVDQPDVFILW